MQHQAGSSKLKRKLHHGPELLSEDLDVSVLGYLDAERSEGRVVRNKDLMRRALELAGGLQLENFAASPMWLKRWKIRHDVSTRCSTSTQKLSSSNSAGEFSDYGKGTGTRCRTFSTWIKRWSDLTCYQVVRTTEWGRNR